MLERAANSSGSAAVRLTGVTSPYSFVDHRTRHIAAGRVSAELAPLRADELLGAEAAAWRDWPGARLEIKPILGEGFAAAAAWQCLAAIAAARQGGYAGAVTIVMGAYHEAIGARFAVDKTISPG